MNRKKVISVINQKGGVGKTATSYNVAHCLSMMKNQTLLIDLDPSANSTKGLCGVRQFDCTVSDIFTTKASINQAAIAPYQDNEYLWLVPSSIKLAVAQREIRDKYFRETKLHGKLESVASPYTVIIDCSPTLSELTINAIYASDLFIIPISYEQDALEGMVDLFEVINEVKQGTEFDYKILKNGYDKRKDVVNNYIDISLKNYQEAGKIFNTIIRQCEDINRAKMEYQPVSLYSPKSRGHEDYMKLAEEIIHA